MIATKNNVPFLSGKIKKTDTKIAIYLTKEKKSKISYSPQLSPMSRLAKYWNELFSLLVWFPWGNAVSGLVQQPGPVGDKKVVNMW